MKKKWFITEEWNESDQLPHGRRTSKVNAYGLCYLYDIRNTAGCMNRYSHYDYVDSMTYDTREQYENMLKTLEENGSVINREYEKI